MVRLLVSLTRINAESTSGVDDAETTSLGTMGRFPISHTAEPFKAQDKGRKQSERSVFAFPIHEVRYKRSSAYTGFIDNATSAGKFTSHRFTAYSALQPNRRFCLLYAVHPVYHAPRVMLDSDANQPERSCRRRLLATGHKKRLDN